MTADRDRLLVQLVSGLPTARVSGRFYRYSSRRRAGKALNGSTRGGRWGPKDTFPVLYLVDDYDACVIEAYRHAVDPGIRPDPTPRPANYVLLSCDVDVDNLLDLRTATARTRLGLEPAILHSEPQGLDGEAYRSCGRVALAAHQLRRKGIIVPSATHIGHTLALFTDVLEEGEQPTLAGGLVQWRDLPADPRRLHLVEEHPADD